jgi:hypothetical protein
MEQITLELPTDLAQRFYALSATDKNAITAFVSSWINNKNTDEKRRLEAKQRLLKTINEIRQEATERGMTDDILNDILSED